MARPAVTASARKAKRLRGSIIENQPNASPSLAHSRTSSAVADAGKHVESNDEGAIEAKIDDLAVNVALTSIELTKDEERNHNGLENIPEIERAEDGKARKE